MPRSANYNALAEEYDAWLMTDDAHGIGVVGGGRGSSFIGNSHVPVPLQMGTLSKAIGAYGGYLCASEAVVDLIRNRARTLIYSTGLPPSCVAASIAALDLIEREPAYAALPVQKAKAFTKAAGLPEAQSPIVPVIVGAEEATLAASQMLADEGLSRRRHPSADRAARHLAPALYVHRATSRRRDRAARHARARKSSSVSAISSPRPAPISARPSSPPD